MAFDNSYTAVTGATYTASDYNTYTKGNFSAVWVGTTAGDLDYYTSATAKSRLALTAGGVLVAGASAPQWEAGSAFQLLMSNGSSPAEFSSLVYRRQGGNASNWQTAGTTTYTPTAPKVQAGVKSISINTTGTVTITYPVTFTNRPVVFISINCGSGSITHQVTDDSVSGFTVNCRDVVTSGAITADVNWLAIGE